MKGTPHFIAIVLSLRVLLPSEGELRCQIMAPLDIPSSVQGAGLKKVGEWPYGISGAAAVRNNLAYIGNGRTIQIVDIADPASFRVLDEYVLPFFITANAMEDSMLYVSSGAMIYTFNISGDALELVSEFALTGSGSARDLHAGDRLLVALTHSNIHILDMTIPDLPIVRGMIAAHPEVQGMTVADSMIYVSYGMYGGTTDIIDIHDPANPVYRDDFGSFFTDIPDVGIRDSLAFLPFGKYLGDSTLMLGLSVFNVDNPDSVLELSLDTIKLEKGYGKFGIQPIGITIIDTTAYVMTLDSGVIAISINDPQSVEVLWQAHRTEAHPPEVTRLASNGRDILTITVTSGVWILDSLDRVGPHDIASYRTGSYSRSSVPHGDILVVSEDRAGLTLLDVENPGEPAFLSSLELPRRHPVTDYISVNQISISGDLVFLGTTAGVEIADVSEKLNPEWVGYVPYDTIVGVEPGGVFAVDSSCLFVFESDSSFKVYDISTISSIQLVQEGKINYFYSSFVHMVTRHGIAYIGNDNKDSILTVRASKDSSPVALHYLPIWARAFELDDSLLYCATSKGISVLSLAPPELPQTLDELTITPFGGWGIDVSDRHAFLQGYDDFAIVDISDPRNLHILDSVQLGPVDYTVKGDYLFLHYMVNGLGVYLDNLTDAADDPTTPTARNFRLLGTYPNPFNNSTTIAYRSPRPGSAVLRVYGSNGQLVDNIPNQAIGEGFGSFTYTTDHLPTGVYFFAINFQNGSEWGKMIVIR